MVDTISFLKVGIYLGIIWFIISNVNLILLTLGIALFYIYSNYYEDPLVRVNYDKGKSFESYVYSGLRKKGIDFKDQKRSRTTGKIPDIWIPKERRIGEIKNVANLHSSLMQSIIKKYSGPPFYPKKIDIYVPRRTRVTANARAIAKENHRVTLHRLWGFDEG